MSRPQDNIDGEKIKHKKLTGSSLTFRIGNSGRDDGCKNRRCVRFFRECVFCSVMKSRWSLFWMAGFKIGQFLHSCAIFSLWYFDWSCTDWCLAW